MLQRAEQRAEEIPFSFFCAFFVGGILYEGVNGRCGKLCVNVENNVERLWKDCG